MQWSWNIPQKSFTNTFFRKKNPYITKKSLKIKSLNLVWPLIIQPITPLSEGEKRRQRLDEIFSPPELEFFWDKRSAYIWNTTTMNLFLSLNDTPIKNLIKLLSPAIFFIRIKYSPLGGQLHKKHSHIMWM